MVSKTVLKNKKQILSSLGTYSMKLCEFKRVKNQNKLKNKCGVELFFEALPCVSWLNWWEMSNKKLK